MGMNIWGFSRSLCKGFITLLIAIRFNSSPPHHHQHHCCSLEIITNATASTDRQCWRWWWRRRWSNGSNLPFYLHNHQQRQRQLQPIRMEADDPRGGVLNFRAEWEIFLFLPHLTVMDDDKISNCLISQKMLCDHVTLIDRESWDKIRCRSRRRPGEVERLMTKSHLQRFNLHK